MCDVQPNGRVGWRGWRQWLEQQAACPSGQWQDLNHKFHNELPVSHLFPKPSFGRIASMRRPSGEKP